MKVRITIFWLVLFLFYSSFADAQYCWFQSDARSQAMSGIRAVNVSQWSGIDNPSSLAGIQQTSAGIYYLNYYELAELGLAAFYGNLRTKTGNYGISFLKFGRSQLTQNAATLSYGKSIGKIFRGGISIHCLTINQPEDYTDFYAFIPTVGLQLIPVKGLMVGAYVFNPAGQDFIPAGIVNIPVTIRAGLGYYPAKEIMICMESEKSTGEKIAFTGGVELVLMKKLASRFGISTGSTHGYSFGLGYQHKNLCMDIAVKRHSVLGFSPAIGLSYAIK